MSSITDDHSLYAKLEAVKEIRSKMLHLEKIKSRLISEVEAQDQEDKCLAEYKQEMELLLQEKMAHVEELRQIHADINAMEGVIKHAEENRCRSLSYAVRLHEEYTPLKAEVDRLRQDYLGLDRLPELHEEEGSSLTADRFSRLYNSNAAKAQLHAYVKSSSEWNRPITNAGTTSSTLTPAMTSTFLQSQNSLRLVASKTDHSNRTASIAPAAHSSTTPSFRSDQINLRQQPPPMKSCLSCHQQMRRNAPICPLCKAKSRSRNPKKPKKKDH